MKVLLLFLLLTNSVSYANESKDKLVVADFSSESLEGWQSKSFKGQTSYQIIDLAGKKVLKAESVNSASGLYKEQRVDLRQTPFLNWEWRVENRLSDLNEQEKSGDDYAARVYVIVRGGLAFWRTRAINYVWASSSSKGKIWPNAYAGDHAMMIALRSENDSTGIWVQEKRNVFADLKQQFGEDIDHIDAVAIMTDTDNSNGSATAYYGNIFFSSH